MASLKNFPEIKERLRSSKKQQVDALHEFVFESPGNRNNRQRLRDFAGFEFDKNDERYVSKIQYVYTKLNDMGLLSICLLLGINHNTQDLKAHIFENLCKNTFLKDLVDDSNDDDDNQSTEDEQVNDDENVNENEDNNRNVTTYDDARSVVSSNTDTKLNYNHESKYPHFSLNFRDVEDSIRLFSGNATIPIENWLQEYEKMALLMGWNELQKMIFAKKALKGIAGLYIMSERGLNT